MSSNAMNASDSVFGHYVQQGHLWEPLLSESSPLFRAIVNDDARVVEAELEPDSTKANQFFVLLYWGSRPTSPEATSTVQTPSEDGTKPAVTVKRRTLLMIAAFHGSMRVLALLAVNGADPATVSPDGLTAYQLAYSSHRPEAATVVAYLKDAEQSLQVLRGQLDASGKLGLVSGEQQFSLEALPAGGVDLSDPQMRGRWNIPAPTGRKNGGDPFGQDGLPYSTAELTKPEYSTDEFRMFCFKILRCCRRYAHDWRACPFAHPTENARRRDPREFKYCSIPCPDYKQGFCIRGDSCPYAHGVFECWLHPSKYRTQLCKDGNKCRRPVCFFAHSLTELRSPTHTWTPAPDALKNPVPCIEQEESSESSPAIPVGQYSDEINDSTELTNPVLKKEQDIGSNTNTGELPPTVPPLKTADSSQTLSSLDRSASQEGLGSGSYPKKAQAPKNAGFTPRMSNAFARQHGLDPKDGPTVNYLKLSGRQGGNRPASAIDRRSQSFDSRSASSFNRSSSARQRRMKQGNHHSAAALDSLNFSMNSISFSGTRPESAHSLTDASSFALAAAGGGGGGGPRPPPSQTNYLVEPMPQFGRGLQHSHSTGEHLRSHSAILPDLTGSLDSSFQLLNTPSLANAPSFLGLQNYVLGHSASYTPGNSFSVPIPDGGGGITTPTVPVLNRIGSVEMNYQHHQAAMNAMRQNSENSGATT
eukprot:g4290.t1